MWVPDPVPNLRDLTLPGPDPDPVANMYPRVPESLESSNFLKKIYNLEQKCVNFWNSVSSEKILPLKEKNNTKIKSFFPNFEHKNAKKNSNVVHFHIFLII